MYLTCMTLYKDFAGALDSAFAELNRHGHFVDPVKRAVEEVFLPWLRAQEEEEPAEVLPVTDAEVLVVLVSEEHIGRPAVRAALLRAAAERAMVAAEEIEEGGD
ncbi:hypothetical protein WJX81_004200 [Elliptochloris bilobata]|uniref:Uncharacterized protein n=1 Tax=Elliptochloris bilobata TaxID=381761 RepID=A0AAW1R3F0_9CHLO